MLPFFEGRSSRANAPNDLPPFCLFIVWLFFTPQVAPGNNDMDTARALQSDHPEVVMFGRRCLGDAAGLYAKAKALADAGNDQMAVKVRRGAAHSRRCVKGDRSSKRQRVEFGFVLYWSMFGETRTENHETPDRILHAVYIAQTTKPSVRFLYFVWSDGFTPTMWYVFSTSKYQN